MMKRIRLVFVSGALAGFAAWALVPPPVAGRQARIDFARDIKPIFEASCASCHGPRKALGQLRLDDRKLAFEGGISGRVIVPGDSRGSRLLQRILGEGDEARMPMGGDPLPPAQIELIRAWIDQGAVWPDEGSKASAGIAKHWAYLKPQRPNPPAVKQAAWIRNPIDQFILARLEREGLAPAPEAERATLLRRLYLDLVGLPPSVKEIDQFLADRASDAYEKVVDRLLGSRHYGERWARPWLDLARYADSNGYEKDDLRVMWKYRDWVIEALNRDLPFDRFTIEQLAGDLLPSPTTDQLIATGFHRNTMQNKEGGIDLEEVRYEVLVDRVNTTATVWLGSTLACAQCHNHKYDPFSQKDYYRFYAFFDSTEYKDFDLPGSERWVEEPILDLPTPEQARRRKAIDDEIKRLNLALKTQTPALDAAQSLWEREMLAEGAKWKTLEPIEVTSEGGATFTTESEGTVFVSGANPEIDTYRFKTRAPGGMITGLRIEALTDRRLPQGGPGRDPYGNFLLTGLEVEAAPTPTAQARPVSFKDLGVDDSAYRIDAKRFFQPGPLMSAVDAPRGWYINATRDEVRLDRQGVFIPTRPFGSARGTALTIRLKFLGGSLGQGIGRFRISVTSDADPLRIVKLPARLRPVLEKPGAERTAKERDDLSAQFRALTPLLKAQRDRLAKLRDQLKELGITTALIMREKRSTVAPATNIRERGNFMTRGERVTAGIPAVFGSLPETAKVNRLALAEWLVDKDHPLVARVAVNRYWEQIFGRGIVETSEDFGTQSQSPTHPELLDHLASEFVRLGWSQKAILRLIVTSATYRQSSSAAPALLERDPDNRLLARGPRFRMEAEMVRDAALSASGLLSRRIGGPSVFPPQPEGIWRNPYSSAKWNISPGEDRYRRSIYTFLRRTSPYPSLMTFDATSREYCTVRRVRTNTPLQALVALNDEAYFEMARALAQRILAESEIDLRKRLSYGFRLCTGREPKQAESDRLVALYQQQLKSYQGDPAAAARVIKGGGGGAARHRAPELAAWTIVANVLLNLDETLTKE